MSEKESTPEAAGSTRRDFLRGVTLGGAGLALAGMLGGCSSQDGGTRVPETGQSVDQDGRPYAVHVTDVLVVGAGLTGMTAARIAMENGAQVVMIEKGKYGHCGNTGIAHGTLAVTSEYAEDKTGMTATSAFALDLCGIADQEFLMNNVQVSLNNPFLKFCEQSGSIIERSRLDGDLWGMSFYPGDSLGQQAFNMVATSVWRPMAQGLQRLGCEIHDRMMMVDFVKDPNGAIAGVVAINLKDGSAHLFRAKAVIMATGSFHWAHGQTIGGPDCTGETQVLFLKNGLAMRDIELNLVDMEGSGPFGQMLDGPDQGWMEPVCGAAIGGPYYATSLNKDGEVFMKGYFEKPDLTFVENFVGTILCSVREIHQGKANEDDSLYMDASGIVDGNSPMSIRGQVTEWAANAQDGFGEDSVDLSRVKCYLQSYGSAATPKMDPATLETEIPGLHYAGATNGSLASYFCWGQGHLSGKAAAEAAKAADLPDYDEQDVQDVLARSYGFLEKEFAADSIRPITIQRKIQATYAKNLLTMRDEAGIKKAIDEFNRIKNEDLPKMAVADRSRHMNKDWRNAMEVEGMLYMCMAAATAALERKDTRPMHFRFDYPTMDNENYLAHLWVSMDEAGNFSIEKGEINDKYVPVSEIIAQLPQIDLTIPNPEPAQA